MAGVWALCPGSSKTENRLVVLSGLTVEKASSKIIVVSVGG